MPIRQRPICLTYAVIAGFLGVNLLLAPLSAQPAPSSDASPGATAKARKINESASKRREALDEAAAQRQKRREEWNAKALETLEARDRRRAECRSMAKEQDLHLIKRVRFIKKCMAGGLPR